jgi:uncharacterized protein (DUF488 family)
VTAGQTIATIGHGDRSFGEVAAALFEHAVGFIVDVRSIPYSRHAPDFTKDRLLHLAAEMNLGYRWLGDRLGGRPEDPALWRDGKPDLEAIAATESFAAGITEVEGLAEANRIALLCSEVDPTACHRATLLAPELERRGHHVVHIVGDGTAVAHQPSLGLD